MASPPRLLAVILALLVAMGAAQAQIEERGPRSDGPSESTLRHSFPGGGDPLGIVEPLARKGIEFRLSYITDTLGNIRGGRRQGWINQGLFEPSVEVDFEKLAGLSGLRGYVNAFFIHNTGRIRRDYVGGVNTIAAIEAMPRIRLSELWLEQSFANGVVRLRAGQIAADVEFLYSDLSVMFLQSDFPTISALNLPGGGPAYPLATPGIFVQIEPNERFNFRAALFNGQAAPPGTTSEQVRNRYNTNFRVRDPGLIFAEARLQTNQEDGATGLARILRLGGWAHLGHFDHSHRAADGTLLADAASSGVPLRRRGNGGIYAVLDQQLWRPSGGDALSGVSMFGRVSIAPSERSNIGFYADAGVVFANLVPGRPKDRFGLSFTHARYAEGVRRHDDNLVRLNPEAPPRRSSESNLEVTYLAEIMPGFDLQPVITHIWNPSERPGRNALVIGLRTRLLY
jgi:porin